MTLKLMYISSSCYCASTESYPPPPPPPHVTTEEQFNIDHLILNTHKLYRHVNTEKKLAHKKLDKSTDLFL